MRYSICFINDDREDIEDIATLEMSSKLKELGIKYFKYVHVDQEYGFLSEEDKKNNKPYVCIWNDSLDYTR